VIIMQRYFDSTIKRVTMGNLCYKDPTPPCCAYGRQWDKYYNQRMTRWLNTASGAAVGSHEVVAHQHFLASKSALGQIRKTKPPTDVLCADCHWRRTFYTKKTRRSPCVIQRKLAVH